MRTQTAWDANENSSARALSDRSSWRKEDTRRTPPTTMSCPFGQMVLYRTTFCPSIRPLTGQTLWIQSLDFCQIYHRWTGFPYNPLCRQLPYAGPLPDSCTSTVRQVPPASDGGPDSWFTQGNAYNGYRIFWKYVRIPQRTGRGYDLVPPPWIRHHPAERVRGHGRGLCNNGPGRTECTAGNHAAIPEFDIPLIIQDRSFDTNGQLFYNLASNPQPNPNVHPLWIPEFIGDVICVDGKTWPYLEVEPRQYRFRLLNGSNARFYDLTIVRNSAPLLPFFTIATDDGYLENAVATSHIHHCPRRALRGHRGFQPAFYPGHRHWS